MPHDREATTSHALATAARQMVDGVHLTAYEHALIIDPDAGTYYTDCSGFVSFVLERVAPEHYGVIPHELAHPYPKAFEFFDYFASRAVDAVRGWRRVERFCDARAGDLVAWRLRHLQEDKDSGHVFVVAEAPKLASSDVWAVRVYDASDVLHFEDSRERGGIFAGGVGTGTILVHTDAHGKPTGFQFGPGESAHEAPIAVARIEPA